MTVIIMRWSGNVVARLKNSDIFFRKQIMNKAHETAAYQVTFGDGDGPSNYNCQE